jgi:DNA-binding transcriptional ArsR family regulator
MRDLELALKAAGDPTRTRILMLLERGPLCVCQLQVVLGLAASTVSRHLSVLKTAGFVHDRRDGKWVEYALADPTPNAYVESVRSMIRGGLERDRRVVADRRRLREVKRTSLEELCEAMATRGVSSSLSRPAPRSRG